MASNTPNLNLYKKDPLVDGNDTFNIKTMLNDNWDKIDEAIGEVNTAISDINIPVRSVNQKAGDVVLTATDVGAETPTGAQTKANAAEQNAKDYTDQEVGALSGETGQAIANVNQAIDNINQVVAAHLAEDATDAHSPTNVGLGNVKNYDIATKAEAEAGTVSNKYITPLGVKQAIAKLALGKATNETTGKQYTIHIDEEGLYLKEV